MIRAGATPIKAGQKRLPVSFFGAADFEAKSARVSYEICRRGPYLENVERHRIAFETWRRDRVRNRGDFAEASFCSCARSRSLARAWTTPALHSQDSGPGPEYVVGPLDTLSIFVWRHPELSQSIPVRPDGRISIPLIEDMSATGKTSTQLASDLQEQLKKFIQDPIVTVIVTSFNGPYDRQIWVVGEAAHPQAIPYRDNMTLLDAMIAVGGLTQYAAGNRATVVRRVQRQGDGIPVQTRRSPPEWRCLGQCAAASGRSAHHSTELVLAPPACRWRFSRGNAPGTEAIFPEILYKPVVIDFRIRLTAHSITLATAEVMVLSWMG